MKRYRISWRMGVDVTENPAEFGQLLDILTHDGVAGDEFWIFLSEPTSHGYDPLDEVARKCDMYKIAAEAAKKRGIRVGINPWPTFGSEEGWQAAVDQTPLPFPPMVDKDGKQAQRVACPISPEFISYSQERYRLFARTGASFVWVDDDCRFTHLGELSYPCFCPRCVQGFQHGAWKSRESLVAALNEPQNGDLRRAWSAYGAQRLAAFCAAVRQAVDEVDPAIETPFMSVGYSHTSFSGDYIAKCMTALRAKAARPGHGYYTDENPMGMFDKVYEVSRQIPDMIPAVMDDIQYEEESCPMTPMNKASGTRLTEMGLSVWAGCNGVAMNHVLHTGGRRPFDYLRGEAALLKQARPFFDRYLSFVDGLPQLGLWGAYSAWAASGVAVTDKGWFNETDPAYYASRFVHEWPCFGHPVTAQREGSYGTLLQGRLPEVFTDEALSDMLKKPLIMDAEALQVMWARGFGKMCGVKVTGSHRGGAEKLADSPYAGEFAGSTHYTLYNPAYNLEPVADGVEVLAHVARPYGVKDEICAAKYGHVVVLGFDPYTYTGVPGHQHMLRALEKALGANVLLEPADDYDCPRVATFARGDGRRAAVLLINGETTPASPFDVLFKGDAATARLLWPTGQEKTLPLTRRDGYCAARIDAMQPWEMAVALFE